MKTAVIHECKPADKDDDRPADQQKWCLYTSDGSRLLGRHPSKEKAENQERAIQVNKHSSLRARTIRLAHEKPELREHLLPILKEATVEEDSRLVREALSILPKRSSYSTFKVVEGQGQYWFDLTYPYTDWTYKKGVSSHNDNAYRTYFEALLKKIKPKLAVYGAIPVARDLSVVIVKE